MSIGAHAGNVVPPRITGPEAMYQCICQMGIVPFFENPIRGYSIEELTPPENWFDGDDIIRTPWDWKIYSVQSGDIAYGKFLWGGKAAFATIEWYRELMNYRRSLPKYAPDAAQQQILDYLEAHGSISIKEVRGLLGVKKGAADTQIARLMMQCRVVTGDIQRVYRGEDLHYNGWQVSSFCTPEALFETDADMEGLPEGFPFKAVSLKVGHSPEASLQKLLAHIRELVPSADEKLILKALG